MSRRKGKRRAVPLFSHRWLLGKKGGEEYHEEKKGKYESLSR